MLPSNLRSPRQYYTLIMKESHICVLTALAPALKMSSVLPASRRHQDDIPTRLSHCIYIPSFFLWRLFCSSNIPVYHSGSQATIDQYNTEVDPARNVNPRQGCIPVEKLSRGVTLVGQLPLLQPLSIFGVEKPRFCSDLYPPFCCLVYACWDFACFSILHFLPSDHHHLNQD